MENSFIDILNNYSDAQVENFTNHPIAKKIRNDIPFEIENIINNKERYKVQGSPGQGNWNTCPWIDIFDILVTRSAQSGYYPVFLFCKDMSGLYFSMNQGVTEITDKYKRDAKTVLKDRAKDFRNQLGQLPESFPLVDINLKMREDTTF